MLIRYAATNHLSIKGREEMSLVASAIKDKGAALLRTAAFPEQVLPAILIYGANASGKSNVLEALNFIVRAVTYSHTLGSPKGGVPRHAFALDNGSSKITSDFEVEFISQEIRYAYGFEADDQRFVSEWLYAYPNGRRQMLFYRSDGSPIEFGKSLRGQLRSIESLMRSNSLFLSTAAQNAHPQLTLIFEYITGINFVMDVGTNYPDVYSAYSSGDMEPRVIEFIRSADTGIVGAKFDMTGPPERSNSDMVREFVELLKKHVPGTDVSVDEINTQRRLTLGHRSSNGEIRYLSLDSESSGTLRLLALLKSIFRALDQGTVVIIDELDASLHTYLAERIVTLFSDELINPKGAQLIATTHDTNLLSSSVVRRDQIWFAEKDQEGASHFYPLSDIKTRHTDNLERGYLEGRFGAVPFRHTDLTRLASNR